MIPIIDFTLLQIVIYRTSAAKLFDSFRPPHKCSFKLWPDGLPSRWRSTQVLTSKLASKLARTRDGWPNGLASSKEKLASTGVQILSSLKVDASQRKSMHIGGQTNASYEFALICIDLRACLAKALTLVKFSHYLWRENHIPDPISTTLDVVPSRK